MFKNNWGLKRISKATRTFVVKRTMKPKIFIRIVRFRACCIEKQSFSFEKKLQSKPNFKV